MAVLELFKTLSISLELSRNLVSMVFPLLSRAEADTESRMVLGMVEIDNLAQDGHEREKISEYAMSRTFKVRSSPSNPWGATRGGNMNARITGVELASLFFCTLVSFLSIAAKVTQDIIKCSTMNRFKIMLGYGTGLDGRDREDDLILNMLLVVKQYKSQRLYTKSK